MADDLFSVAAGGSSPSLLGPPITIPPGMNPMEFFLQRTPGWQFAYGEGARGIQNSAGARGTLLGRQRTLSAIPQYLQGVADQTYGAQVGRYLSLADLGLRAATAPFI